MAGKEGEARREVLAYGRQFPSTRLNKMFRAMAATPLTWSLWCRFLRWREFHRQL